MKWRLALLGLILFIRLAVNYIYVAGYRLGEVASFEFDSYKIQRSGSDCILRQGLFGVRDKAICGLLKGKIVRITGNLEASLTDRLLGRIWLNRSSNYAFMEVVKRENQAAAEPSGGVVKLREKLARLSFSRLPSPEGELVMGIVLGYKSSLPEFFYNQLVQSGTVHVVVASGYNVMVVAGLALAGLLVSFRRRLATGGAIVVIWLYVILAGGEVSLLRAAVMGSVVLTGLAWGRQTKVCWSLLLTIGVMLVISPALIESVSFQLSVAATFGVAIIGPWLKDRLPGADRLDLTTSLGALLATAPLIWWHFGRVSWISLVSNVFILPLIPALMFLGGAMLSGGLVFAPLAGLLVWPTYALAHLVVILVSLFGGGV